MCYFKIIISKLLKPFLKIFIIKATKLMLYALKTETGSKWIYLNTIKES